MHGVLHVANKVVKFDADINEHQLGHPSDDQAAQQDAVGGVVSIQILLFRSAAVERLVLEREGHEFRDDYT